MDKDIIFPFLSATFRGKLSISEPGCQELHAESSFDIDLDSIKVIPQTGTSTEPDSTGLSILKQQLKVYWGPQEHLTDDERNKKNLLHIKLKIRIEKGIPFRNVQISGEFLQDLFYICNGQVFPSLEIFVEKKSMLFATNPNLGIRFSSDGFQSDNPLDKELLLTSKTYWESFTRINSWNNYQAFVNSVNDSRLTPASISLTIRYKLPAVEEAHSGSKACLMEKILRDKLYTDVELVSLDGAINPCHKSILAAASPVLASLLQSPMEETKTNQIQFDMEESSVTAFLEYLYTVGMHKPAQDSRIAVDLLEAGHKYDIPGMEKCMKAILLSRPAQWFEVDAALKMFMFARNLDSYDQVTTKAVEVMKCRRSKLGTSEEFKDLLKRSPEASAVAIAELINAMFDTALCKCEKPQE